MALKRWSVGLATGSSDLFGLQRRRSGTDPTGYTAIQHEDDDYYLWQESGWNDDECLPESDDGQSQAVFRDLESKKTVHRFTLQEEARMAHFESIDYWVPNTKLYRNNLEQLRRKGRGTKWFVYCLIGVIVGICSVLLMNTIELLSSKRRSLLENSHWGTDADKWIAFAVWLGFSFALAGASTGLCGLWPYASGSGVPDVMAYLNGITFPKVFNLRTLVGKILSCSLAVASGLPVGPEGPMIHIGALIGAGIGTGRSRTLGRGIKFFSKYRNPRDHRDFITGGAAAGVACAFSAPIGGLLFVVEEMASVFNKKAMWMAFFASLMAIITANTVNSKLSGWQVRDDLNNTCTQSFSWNQHFTILFKSNALEDVNLISVPFTMILGVITGFMGACFTFFNIKVSRFRMTRINKSTTKRMLEPLTILLLFLSTSFLAVYLMPCKDKPQGGFDLNWGTAGRGELKYFDSICEDSEKQYHPLGTLVFASADNVVRLLFRRSEPEERTPDDPLVGTKLFDYSSLLIWLVIYFFFACWSAGTYLACGLVVPMLIMGATMGRIYGLVVVDFFQSLLSEDCTGVDAWVDPGVFAMFGAAGFFAGVSRLTFSLCVIMLEITGDLPHLPNIMLCVMISKTVADALTHSLYHALMDLKCVPFLDWDIHLPYLDCYTARQLVQSNPPLCVLHVKDTIANIYRCLSETPHNAFPVVNPGGNLESGFEGAGTFRGTVLREQLEQLLWFLDGAEQNPAGDLPKLDYDEMVELKEKIFWERLKGLPFKESLPPHLSEKTINLLPLTNTSAFSVPDTMSVSGTYTLFRSMGLRHLVVVNKVNSVIGVLTRKDLVAHTILKNTIEGDMDPGTEEGDRVFPSLTPDWNGGSGSRGSRRWRDSGRSFPARMASSPGTSFSPQHFDRPPQNEMRCNSYDPSAFCGTRASGPAPPPSPDSEPRSL